MQISRSCASVALFKNAFVALITFSLSIAKPSFAGPDWSLQQSRDKYNTEKLETILRENVTRLRHHRNEDFIWQPQKILPPPQLLFLAMTFRKRQHQFQDGRSALPVLTMVSAATVPASDHWEISTPCDPFTRPCEKPERSRSKPSYFA